MRTVFFAFAFFLAGIRPALGSPLDNAHTHHTALTAPELSVSSASFKMARTWFLPDWQAGWGSRSDTAPSGGGDIPLGCEKYSPKCSSPRILGGVEVRAAGDLFCPMECVCPDSYKYTSSNCFGDRKPSGSVCDGKYNACQPKTCEERGLKTCGSGCIAVSACCSDSDCGSGKKCSSGSCVAKSCEEMGQKTCNGSCIATSACCTNNDCGSGKKCSSGSCVAKTCEEMGQKTCNGSCIASSACCTDSDCGSDKKCSSGSCVAKTCEEMGQKTCNGKCIGKTACCVNGDCASGLKCFDNVCVSQTCEEKGQKTCNGSCIASSACCTDSDCGSGKKCSSGSCVAKSCEEMGQKTCNGSCIATSACCTNNDCGSGKKCSSGTCVSKTCEEMGQKTCNGSCIATSACCTNSDCGSGNKCSSGSCVAGTSKTCEIGDIYYSNRECSSERISSLTALGIVIDPEQRMIFHYGAMTGTSLCPSGRRCYTETGPNMPTISNEDIGDNSAFNGYFNTEELANKISSPAAQFCKSLPTFDGAILKNWYFPAKGEMKKLIDNMAAINAKHSTTNFHALTFPMLTSSEVLSVNLYESDAMWAYDGANFTKNSKATGGYVRCFAHYPDLNGDTSKDYALPCPFLRQYNSLSGYMEDTSSNSTPFSGMDINYCKNVASAIAPSLDGLFFDDYTFNPRCRRCAANTLKSGSTGGGTGGDTGGTTPTKTPCQKGDYYYSVTTTENALCSASPVSNRTLLGRVLYTTGDGTGVILHHKFTNDYTYRNNAMNMCSAYKLGIANPPGGNWRLAVIDELRKNNNWESYINGNSNTRFWIQYTSLPYLFTLGGEGPMSPSSNNDDYQGICISSFRSSYRK